MPLSPAHLEVIIRNPHSDGLYGTVSGLAPHFFQPAFRKMLLEEANNYLKKQVMGGKFSLMSGEKRRLFTEGQLLRAIRNRQVSLFFTVAPPKLDTPEDELVEVKSWRPGSEKPEKVRLLSVALSHHPG